LRGFKRAWTPQKEGVCEEEKAIGKRKEEEVGVKAGRLVTRKNVLRGELSH